MHRVLERLDSTASTAVPLLYLSGLLLATMAYFSGLTLDFGIAAGVALAVATELHSFLQQRRFRAAWGAYRRASGDDTRRTVLAGEVRTNALVMAVLMVFSTFCSLQFTASVWHPVSTGLPAPVQIGIRGSILPLLFALAGFLSPLTMDGGEVLKRASGDMLHKTIAATVKQWSRRIEAAQQRGHDLAPIAVSLMMDAGDQDGARRIQLISTGLAQAEGKQSPVYLLPEHETPLAISNETAPEDDGPVIQLASIESAEQRVYAVLKAQPRASITAIARQADCAESTASKYRRLWQASHAV